MKENTFTLLVDFLNRYRNFKTPTKYAKDDYEEFIQRECANACDILNIEKDIPGGLKVKSDFDRRIIIDLIPVISNIKTQDDIKKFLSRDDVIFLCPELNLNN